MTSLPSKLNAGASAYRASARALPMLIAKLLRRLRWLARGSRLLMGIAAVALLVWAAVGVDALWPLGQATRGTLRIALPIAALALLVWALWPRRRPSRAAMHGAAMVEQQRGLAQHPLATAMTLPDDAPNTDPFTRALRQRAQDRADAIVQPDDAAKTAPLSRLAKPLGWLWLAMVLWAVTALLFPTLLTKGLGRLMLPAADIPPFSLTSIDVAWEPATPTVGDDVLLTATPQGLQPDEVVMVFLDANHRPVERRPLLQTVQTQFETRLQNLREPVTFHLEAHGRRTRRYTITPDVPEPAPDDPAADEADTAQPAPGNGQADTSDDEPEPGVGEAAGEPNGAPDSEAPALLGELADLINELADLAEQAQRSAAGDGPTPQELAEMLEALAGRAGDLADELDEAAGDASASAALSQALGRLAEALRGLQSPGMLPGPGQPGPGDQPGYGESLAESARADAAGLAQGLGESQRALLSGRSAGGGEEESPEFRDPATSGRYDETLGGAQEGVLPDALMQQVPPRYRDQTADYFRRLAEQQLPDTPRNNAPNDPPEDSP